MTKDNPGQAPVKPPLTAKQKAALIEWIAEGIGLSEINSRAGKFKPAFRVSRQLLSYYRQTVAGPELERRKAANAAAFARGFALKEKRIQALDKLAREVLKDLKSTGLWLLQGIETTGQGDDKEYHRIEKFNSAELDAFRSLLDDIAREQGARNARGLALEVPPGGRIKFIVGVDESEI